MKDWNNDEVELVNKKGEVVNVGDQVISFRNEAATLVHCSPPHKSSSQGKITVSYGRDNTREYYPSVFDLKYRKVSPVSKLELSFICIGGHAWGRGPTLKEARKKWRASGGSGKCENEAVVAYTGKTHPYVDELGTFYTEHGAVIGWLRKEGKQQ